MLYNKPFDQTNTSAGYVNGNPATNTAGSIPCAEGLEYPQREIVAIIAAAQAMGLDAPSNSDLAQMLKAVRSGLLNYFVGTGTADAITIAPAPAYVGFVPGMTFKVKIPGVAANTTTTPAFQVNNLTAAILRQDGGAPASGDLVGGRVVTLQIDDNLKARVVGLAAQEAMGRLLEMKVWATAGSYIYTPPPGTNFIYVEGLGAGAAGGGAMATSGTNMSVGGPGSAGSYGARLIYSGFAGAAFVIGGGGVPVSGATGGNGGTTSFSNVLVCPGGLSGPVSQPAPSGIGAGGQGSPGPTGGTQGSSTGAPGDVSQGINANSGAYGAAGGSGPWGGGGAAVPSNVNGNAANGPGAGGSGSATTNGYTSNLLGGKGSDGWMKIWAWK